MYNTTDMFCSSLGDILLSSKELGITLFAKTFASCLFLSWSVSQFPLTARSRLMYSSGQYLWIFLSDSTEVVQIIEYNIMCDVGRMWYQANVLTHREKLATYRLIVMSNKIRIGLGNNKLIQCDAQEIPQVEVFVRVALLKSEHL